MLVAKKLTVSWQNIVRGLGVAGLGGLMVLAAALIYLLDEAAYTYHIALNRPELVTHTDVPPFPLGVDPLAEEIMEHANVEAYLEIHFATEYRRIRTITWFDALTEQIAALPWYQSLASPNSRILLINPGERKEEVAAKFGSILGWTQAEKETFVELVTTETFGLIEGTLFPGKYIATPDATPADVAAQIATSFQQKVLDRYPQSLDIVVPLEETLIIASLIEREASSFSDMRAVSGVIWKRLFADMKLQLDATLQYARGNHAWEPKWWPVPRSRDKFIESPYNTYLNHGLPPGPIASPSAAAIIAALNPVDSDCLFYFHHKRKMYCSEDYEAHVAKLREIFGRGR